MSKDNKKCDEVDMDIMESGSIYLNEYRVYGSVKNGAVSKRIILKVKDIKEALGLNKNFIAKTVEVKTDPFRTDYEKKHTPPLCQNCGDFIYKSDVIGKQRPDVDDKPIRKEYPFCKKLEKEIKNINCPDCQQQEVMSKSVIRRLAVQQPDKDDEVTKALLKDHGYPKVETMEWVESMESLHGINPNYALGFRYAYKSALSAHKDEIENLIEEIVMSEQSGIPSAELIPVILNKLEHWKQRSK